MTPTLQKGLRHPLQLASSALCIATLLDTIVAAAVKLYDFFLAYTAIQVEAPQEKQGPFLSVQI